MTAYDIPLGAAADGGFLQDNNIINKKEETSYFAVFIWTAATLTVIAYIYQAFGEKLIQAAVYKRSLSTKTSYKLLGTDKSDFHERLISSGEKEEYFKFA